jgi:hypothetical protein
MSAPTNPQQKGFKVNSTTVRSLKAIARYLTGTEFEDLLDQYRRGAARITIHNGRTISREGFKVIAAYLGQGVA